MPKTSTLTNSTTTDNSDNTVKEPSWNTSPHTLAEFLRDLAEWLPTQDGRFRLLIQYGIALSKAQVVVVRAVSPTRGLWVKTVNWAHPAGLVANLVVAACT